MFGMYGHDFISIILYQIDRFRHRTFRLGIFLSKSYACNMQEKKDYTICYSMKTFFLISYEGGGTYKIFRSHPSNFFFASIVTNSKKYIVLSFDIIALLQNLCSTQIYMSTFRYQQKIGKRFLIFYSILCCWICCTRQVKKCLKTHVKNNYNILKDIFICILVFYTYRVNDLEIFFWILSEF